MSQPLCPTKFVIRAYCEACGHSARLPAWCLGVALDELRRRLRCSRCATRRCSIRVIYVGAGEFHYGRHTGRR